ncbi:MAG: DUF512 domain-containing protein, partial [Moorella sp. (in: Bacteria)]|nr:DUF512 domain-containing protein [Moorella sp. (in: firmicutes)]
NHFFGPEVTVAGLLTGQDLLEGLGETAYWLREKEGIVLLPDVMLKQDTGVFLDDLEAGIIAAKLGVKIKVVPTTGEGLVRGILYSGGQASRETPGNPGASRRR